MSADDDISTILDALAVGRPELASAAARVVGSHNVISRIVDRLDRRTSDRACPVVPPGPEEG